MASGLKKVGLTGHRGFIGRRLVHFIESKGYEVVAFLGDLCDEGDVKQFFDEHSNFSAFIHLAGGFFGSTEDVLKKNTLTAINLANTLSGNSECRFIFLSTGAVYGNTGAALVSEEFELEPNTLNGYTKKWAEEILTSSLKNLVILRLPSVYGPNNDKGVIYSWLESIKFNKSISLHGKGDQLRTFLHVDDLLIGIYRFISHPEAGVYNIAGEEVLSLKGLLDIYKRYFIFDIKYLPAENDLLSMVLGTDKIYEALAWRPESQVERFIGSQYRTDDDIL